MVSRLVLGCGSVGQYVVEAVTDRRGDLSVVCADESRVETLRNENVRAHHADPTNPDRLRALDAPVDVVVVAADDPADNGAIAEAAASVFPEALLVVYLGREATASVTDRVEQVADRVVDPEATVAEFVTEFAASESGVQTMRLRRSLLRVDGTLAVVMHDNPDPDAIASAVALSRIADGLGVDAEACYFGEVSHQENRAFVNLLGLDLVRLSPDADLTEYGGFALVDHSRPGVNDQLPPETEVDVVIDHHPPRGPVEAGFVDLRHDLGATSTLMTTYLQRFGVDLDDTLATALLYGIRIDTRDFTREVSQADFEAAAALMPHVDQSLLSKVESPSVSPETLETLARAIRNRRVRDAVLCTCVGPIQDRDSLAQAADRLLNMNGVATTLVYGFADGTIYVSARTRGTDLDLGETLRMAFDQIGSAGGHADMAGAQIPLGVLGEVEDEAGETLTTVVGDVVMERFFEALHRRPVGDDRSFGSPVSSLDEPLPADEDGPR